MPTEVERAYAAGFFDGEGCIQIARPRKSKGYTLHVSLAQSDRDALEWLCALWGGTVRDHRRPFVFEWVIHTASAGKFLAEIEPYLWVKRPQAHIAVAFQETKRIGKRLTPECLAECESARQQIVALHGNIRSRTAVIPPNVAPLAG